MTPRHRPGPDDDETPIDTTGLASFGLTRREREVIAWVAAGKRNAEIAAILGAKPRTVGKHLERIFEKLGVETRSAAVRIAMDVARSVAPPAYVERRIDPRRPNQRTSGVAPEKEERR